MKIEQTSYVYRHRRLDTNEIFYIGFSEGNLKNYHRARSKNSRNIYWNRIVEKYGFEYEIVADNLSVEDAKELEIFLISIYGRKDKKEGLLVNMADGGEGNLGYIPSDKVKQEHSNRMQGENNPFYGRKHTEESISKILRNRKQLRGEEHHNWGKKYTDEEKKNMFGERPWIKGCNNPNAQEVIDTITLEIFCSIEEASKYYSIARNTMSRYLNNLQINKSTGMFLKDYNEGITFTPYVHPVKVRVQQISTGRIFNSITELSVFLNIKRGKVNYDLKKGVLEDFKII